MGPLDIGQMRCIRPVTGNSAKTARCPMQPWQGGDWSLGDNQSAEEPPALDHDHEQDGAETGEGESKSKSSS